MSSELAPYSWQLPEHPCLSSPQECPLCSCSWSVINHLFKELCEDYAFYSGEDEASSLLGSLFRCFEKFTGSENDWENYVDLGDEKRKEVLAAAYRQFMLNQVVKALELSLEGYKQDNLPWR